MQASGNLLFLIDIVDAGERLSGRCTLYQGVLPLGSRSPTGPKSRYESPRISEREAGDLESTISSTSPLR